MDRLRPSLLPESTGTIFVILPTHAAWPTCDFRFSQSRFLPAGRRWCRGRRQPSPRKRPDPRRAPCPHPDPTSPDPRRRPGGLDAALEDYRKDKLKRAKNAEMKKELDRRRREEEEREREAREREDQSRVSALNISGEEAWKRRAAMSGGPAQRAAPSSPPRSDGGFSIPGSSSSGLGLGAGGQMTAAQRMMAKMGWKAGQGLGKQEQGMTAPLIAKKTDRRAGVIVDESSSRPEKKPKSAKFDTPPTKVLLLRNMIGPGEVDDDLEDEVASECAKYGKVMRVLIFEITQPNFPADEAVRIFIQFEREEESMKALIDLQGRYFGGRTVLATFFDEERFSRNELAPMPGEVAGFD